MKRRIDIAQLQQLTEEQRQKLREWWQPAEFDLFVFYDDTLICEEAHDNGNVIYVAETGKYFKSECLPLPDIGVMIELLSDHRFNLTRYGDLLWRFTLDEEKQFCAKEDTDELCDLLWEAVKSVL